MKKILTILLVALFALSFIGCEDISKKEGYKKYQDIGVEFVMGNVWKTYDDNLMLGGLGDSENDEEPIYNGLEYGFISNELIEEYYDVRDNVEDEDERSQKFTEIFSKVKDLHKIVVFREELVPDKDKLEEVTGCKYNEKLSKKKGFVFYFCYNEFDDSELSEEAKVGYKLLYEDIVKVKKSIKTFKPITPEEAIQELKKIEFNLKDLDGNEINSEEFFKKNKLTMINIWGTFCGPCIREMPDLQELHVELSEEGFAILGIIGDTPDEENEKLAKEMYETKGITFTSIIPDEELKDTLIKSIAGYPTSLFVDSEGNVVGEVITGSRSKEEYLEKIQETFDSLK